MNALQLQCTSVALDTTNRNLDIVIYIKIHSYGLLRKEQLTMTMINIQHTVSCHSCAFAVVKTPEVTFNL